MAKSLMEADGHVYKSGPTEANIVNTVSQSEETILLNFREGGNANAYLGRGWSHQEPDHIWMEGDESELTLSLPNLTVDYEIQIDMWPHVVSSVIESQHLEVFANGVRIGVCAITGAGVLTTRLQANILSQPKLELRFCHPNGLAPITYGKADPRPLSLCVTEIRLRPLSAPSPEPFNDASTDVARIIDVPAVEQLWLKRDYKNIFLLWQDLERAGRFQADHDTKVLMIFVIRASIAVQSFGLASGVAHIAKQLFPDDFYITALEAEIHESAGDIVEAVVASKKAMLLEPSHFQTTQKLASLLIRLRDYKGATELYIGLLSIITYEGPENFEGNALIFLLRLYAMNGPASVPRLAEIYQELLQRGQRGSPELSPFLDRVLILRENNTSATPYVLSLISDDLRSARIYDGTHRSMGWLESYRVEIRDHPQYHLTLRNALVSSSDGAVLDQNRCFAVDHAFHSSDFKTELDTATKTTLLSDHSITGYFLAEGIIWIDTAGETLEVDEDALIVPPGHFTNFGHFVHDVLMLKYGFDRIRISFPKVKIAICHEYDSPIFKHVLHMMFGDPIVLQREHAAFYRFRSTHLLTLPHALWPREGAVCIEPVRYLASSLSDVLKPAKESNKVFIARRGYDAADPEKHVEKIFADCGFYLAYLEDLDMENYFRLLASASHLAGAHGAGLMNFIFGRQEIRVAEIKRLGGNWHSIAAIAHAARVNFTSFDPADGSPGSSERLKAQIRAWCAS